MYRLIVISSSPACVSSNPASLHPWCRFDLLHRRPRLCSPRPESWTANQLYADAKKTRSETVLQEIWETGMVGIWQAGSVCNFVFYNVSSLPTAQSHTIHIEISARNVYGGCSTIQTSSECAATWFLHLGGLGAARISLLRGRIGKAAASRGGRGDQGLRAPDPEALLAKIVEVIAVIPRRPNGYWLTVMASSNILYTI